MHKPETTLKNRAIKFSCVLIYNPSTQSRLELLITKNKRTCHQEYFFHPRGQKSENKSGTIDKYLDLARELKKSIKQTPKGLEKRLVETEKI